MTYWNPPRATEAIAAIAIALLAVASAFAQDSYPNQTIKSAKR
jgi:hypothetical protein